MKKYIKIKKAFNQKDIDFNINHYYKKNVSFRQLTKFLRELSYIQKQQILENINKNWFDETFIKYKNEIIKYLNNDLFNQKDVMEFLRG